MAKAMAPAVLSRALTEKLEKSARGATGSASRVVRAIVIDGEPSFDKGEITDKGSLNQRAMRANHADAAAVLYAADKGVLSV